MGKKHYSELMGIPSTCCTIHPTTNTTYSAYQSFRFSSSFLMVVVAILILQRKNILHNLARKWKLYQLPSFPPSDSSIPQPWNVEILCHFLKEKTSKTFRKSWEREQFPNPPIDWIQVKHPWAETFLPLQNIGLEQVYSFNHDTCKTTAKPFENEICQYNIGTNDLSKYAYNFCQVSAYIWIDALIVRDATFFAFDLNEPERTHQVFSYRMI